MFAKRKLLAVGIIVFLLSCNQNQQDTKDLALHESVPVADTIASSSAAIENNADTSRKFIRTADLKFKVKNVFEATNNIEDITGRHGGFVTYTNLASSTDEVQRRRISKDSLLETTYYTVRNDLTLRIPNTKLDTVLREISQSMDYLDYRIIKADDVGLQLLSNKLAVSRNLKMDKRLTSAINRSGKSLKDIVDAEQTLNDKAHEKDGSEISTLDLTDKINFSTVSLSVYQRQASRAEFIPTDNYVDDYKPGFGLQLLDAFKDGLRVLEILLVSILKLWPLVLIGFLMFLLYNRKRKAALPDRRLL